MANRPKLKNGFDFKSPDLAYLDMLDRATADTLQITEALKNFYLAALRKLESSD